jgi:hypothetical protein
VFDAAPPVHVAPRVGVAAVVAVGPVVAGVVAGHVADSALCHSRPGQAMLGVAIGWSQSVQCPLVDACIGSATPPRESDASDANDGSDESASLPSLASLASDLGGGVIPIRIHGLTNAER